MSWGSATPSAGVPGLAPGSPALLQGGNEWVNDMLSCSRIKRQGYFNPEVIERLKQQYSQEELQKILNDAVDSLKPDFRTVFVLRDIEELSTEETAETLGISVPAVKSRLLRARLQLREKLTRFFKRKGDDAFAYL